MAMKAQRKCNTWSGGLEISPETYDKDFHGKYKKHKEKEKTG